MTSKVTSHRAMGSDAARHTTALASRAATERAAPGGTSTAALSSTAADSSTPAGTSTAALSSTATDSDTTTRPPSGLSAERMSWSVDGRLIVDGIDCTAPAGALTGLLGPNGSGKSTLLRLISGVLAADAGYVAYDGADLFALGRRARARLLAYVEQDASSELPITVRDAVLLGRIPHRSLLAGDGPGDVALADAALARVGMSPFADRSLATLSGGERQRVHMARALTQEPTLFVLDEPTNHLDISAQLETVQLLRELTADGVTVVAALHDLTLAASACDHVVLLSQGTVVAAGPVEQVMVPEVLDPVYGVRCTVLTHPETGRPVLTFAL